MDIEQKITLLKISRKTIELYLEERKKLKISKEDYSDKEFWEEKVLLLLSLKMVI